MFRPLSIALAVCAALVTAALAQQAPTASSTDPTLTPVWNLTTGFAAPESAFYDERSKSVFVSSINGQILDKDGNGYISRLTPDGQVTSEKWVTGLNAPKGSRSVNGTLWVADIDEVVGIEIASARIVSRVKVVGATFLNDLATAPDGTVYVSDSNTLTIYQVKNGVSSVFVAGGDLVEVPNGLLVDGRRLILGTVGPAPAARGTPPPAGRVAAPAARNQASPAQAGHLYAFDLKTKQRTQLTTQPVGGIDGIELDGKGGLLVTDVIGARLLQVTKAGEVRVLAKFSAGGADFGYIPSRRLAIVPFLFGNSVAAYDLTAELK